MKIEFFKAKKHIATLWFILSSILFLLFLFQTLMGKYENKIQEAWGWLFLMILPTLTLMISVFVVDINATQNEPFEVDIFFYRLTMALSALYLIAIIIVILAQAAIGTPSIQNMNQASIFLAPVQGLVSGSIGLFFTKKEKKPGT
jgi:hypothetical protein